MRCCYPGLPSSVTPTPQLTLCLNPGMSAQPAGLQAPLGHGTIYLHAPCNFWGRSGMLAEPIPGSWEECTGTFLQRPLQRTSSNAGLLCYKLPGQQGFKVRMNVLVEGTGHCTKNLDRSLQVGQLLYSQVTLCILCWVDTGPGTQTEQEPRAALIVMQSLMPGLTLTFNQRRGWISCPYMKSFLWGSAD